MGVRRRTSADTWTSSMSFRRSSSPWGFCLWCPSVPTQCLNIWKHGIETRAIQVKVEFKSRSETSERCLYPYPSTLHMAPSYLLSYNLQSYLLDSSRCAILEYSICSATELGKIPCTDERLAPRITQQCLCRSRKNHP